MSSLLAYNRIEPSHFVLLAIGLFLFYFIRELIGMMFGISNGNSDIMDEEQEINTDATKDDVNNLNNGTGVTDAEPYYPHFTLSSLFRRLTELWPR